MCEVLIACGNLATSVLNCGKICVTSFAPHSAESAMHLAGFAGIAPAHIWHITPCFKVMELNCGIYKQFYGMWVHCCIDLYCDAESHFFDAFQK